MHSKIIEMYGTRIAELIKLGEETLKRGRLKDELPWNFREDSNIFYTDGIHHRLGFCRDGKSNGKIRTIGYEMGGACGKWDFWTDGKLIWEQHEDNSTMCRKARMEMLQRFDKEFEDFESRFYAWFDKEFAKGVSK